MNAADVREILDLCACGTWRFRVGTDDARVFLQVEAVAACMVTGKPMQWSGRKWLLSPFMTKSEVVQTAFKAVLTAIEHETREAFRYRGEAIFGPHFDVDRLAELCGSSGALDERLGIRRSVPE